MSIATLPFEPNPANSSQVVCSQLAQRLRSALAEVHDSITPVWPLKDYVAVNPYGSVSERPLLEARSHLRSFSDCELLPSREYLLAEYHAGRIDIEFASRLCVAKAS